LRIWIPNFNCGTYADVLVINGEPEFNGDSASALAELRTDEILNPFLIVEVLSPSTEAYDFPAETLRERGEKFRKYRSLPSLQEYLLVSQTEPYLEQYYNSDRPHNTRWQWQVCDRLEQSIILPSLNLELPMKEIYRRISF
jgi:Uma2 family endonuclease